MANHRLAARMKHEMSMLEHEPPPGVSCWRVEDKVKELKASEYRLGLTLGSVRTYKPSQKMPQT